jgi:hypothetical protein
MKTILFSAAALSFTGAALANGGEWSALAREVETLASSRVANPAGINFSGYADIWYQNSDTDANPDQSGFGVNNARIMAHGGSGGFGAYVEYQLAGGGADLTFDVDEDPGGDADADGNITLPGNDRLLDAYVTQELGGMKLTMGRHKVVGNASAMEHERDMFFQTRSNIGYHFASRDEGLTLSGGEGFNWSIGIADGSDGNTDEYRMSAHGDMDFGGGMSGGITFTSDGANDGETIIVDFAYAAEAFTVGVEFASVGEDGGAFTGATDGSVLAAPTAEFGTDSSPYAVAATFPLGGESAIGLRYQDSDSDAGGTTVDIAYNYGMWGFQYTTSDGDANDGDAITVGLQVGF